jgi:hypothetical protein
VPVLKLGFITVVSRLENEKVFRLEILALYIKLEEY